MAETLPASVIAFKDIFSGASADIASHLSEDVELRPPTYGKSWFGNALVSRLVGFAAAEFGELTYTTVWRNGACYVLRFSGELDAKALSGVDILELDAAGRIRLIEIFARPPGQMFHLRDRMSLRIKQDAEVARAMGLE